jgi:hypothetical protein
MGKGLSGPQRQILILLWEEYGGAALVSQIIEAREGPNFSPAKVGKVKYNQTHSSLSRTLERLRQREMLRIFKEIIGNATAIILTDEGYEVARELSEARMPEN